ncbi:hypothetical protein K466DRAFT_238259 [Polyporus arcularius HHB13444]|uniref:Uncharacterized protein n=1 Tax=Polyporus arcularius HHB13444 TaxID=1314778 RepID=A0A5C3P4W1_9APHY|nr:hypothetical protein K466DRAFT_238259 [Polyporus arcularius HHB13444]
MTQRWESSSSASLLGSLSHPSDVEFSRPWRADPLFPNRRDTTPSPTLSLAASEPNTFFRSGTVHVSVRNHGGHPDTPSQQSRRSSAIPDPHLHDSLTSTCPPSRSGPRHSEDGLSVQTLSTVLPSYHTRRPDHEVEPWTLPPAYGTPHDAARPPSAYIPGRRVLRLHGPRSSPSVSSTSSSQPHTQDRRYTYAASVRTTSSRLQEEYRSHHDKSADSLVAGSSGASPGTDNGGAEGDMHDRWSSSAPSYRTVS